MKSERLWMDYTPYFVIGIAILAIIVLANFNPTGTIDNNPRNVISKDKRENSDHEKRDSGLHRQVETTEENRQSVNKETECSHQVANYNDCIIQLRTTRATERQADIAKNVAWLSLFTLVFSAVAAAGAVAAAVYTAHTARYAGQTLQSDRAWMTFDGPNFAPLANSNLDGVFISDGLLMTVRWKNTGRTPAINVGCYFDHKVVLAGEPDHVFAMRPPGNEGDPRSVIGPNGTAGSPQRALLDNEYAGLRNGTIKVFVYSRVYYNDIFNGEAEPYTEFCGQLAYQGNMITPDGRHQLIVGLHASGPQFDHRCYYFLRSFPAIFF
jgi:hypothetical protein